jgi:hypothetical protein
MAADFCSMLALNRDNTKSPRRTNGTKLYKRLFTTVIECSHAAVSKVTEILAFCVS